MASVMHYMSPDDETQSSVSRHTRYGDQDNKEFEIMKRTIEVLATLLFVTALALGQQYQPLPFPQAANTALASLTAENAAPASARVPSAMAARQVSAPQAADVSPLPTAANPAFGKGWDAMIGHSTDEGGSPFPSAANPSANQ